MIARGKPSPRKPPPTVVHSFESPMKVAQVRLNEVGLDTYALTRKLIFKLGPDTYYRHVWAHIEEGIHKSFHLGLSSDEMLGEQMPADAHQRNSIKFN